MNFQARNDLLKAMGYATYVDYLNSPLWKSIRVRVYAAKGRTCLRCKTARARQIHHEDYDERTMRGESIEPLIPICQTCHESEHKFIKVKRVRAKKSKEKKPRTKRKVSCLCGLCGIKLKNKTICKSCVRYAKRESKKWSLTYEEIIATFFGKDAVAKSKITGAWRVCESCKTWRKPRSFMEQGVLGDLCGPCREKEKRATRLERRKAMSDVPRCKCGRTRGNQDECKKCRRTKEAREIEARRRASYVPPTQRSARILSKWKVIDIAATPQSRTCPSAGQSTDRVTVRLE